MGCPLADQGASGHNAIFTFLLYLYSTLNTTAQAVSTYFSRRGLGLRRIDGTDYTHGQQGLET